MCQVSRYVRHGQVCRCNRDLDGRGPWDRAPESRFPIYAAPAIPIAEKYIPKITAWMSVMGIPTLANSVNVKV